MDFCRGLPLRRQGGNRFLLLQEQGFEGWHAKNLFWTEVINDIYLKILKHENNNFNAHFFFNNY